MKTAFIRVTWEDYDSEPMVEIYIVGGATDEERRRLLASLGAALTARYNDDDEMRDEYDFSNAERGRYAERYRRGVTFRIEDNDDGGLG